MHAGDKERHRKTGIPNGNRKGFQFAKIGPCSRDEKDRVGHVSPSLDTRLALHLRLDSTRVLPAGKATQNPLLRHWKSGKETKLQQERVVICMKWGTLYPAEYVNVLYNAVKRHLPGDFRFVCLTDDATGFEDGIESFPIPDIGLENHHWYNGAWPKISLFSADLYGLSGRALFIDLDMVILQDLTPFFAVEGELVAIDEAAWRSKTAPPSTMSSIFAFTIGSLGYLVDRIRNDRDCLVGKYGLEQAYLHGEVADVRHWPEGWVISFKVHLRQPVLIDRFKGPKAPPPSAKVIAFHGRPRPIDLIRPTGQNWDRSPHYGAKAVPWMQAYWRENGGEI